MEDNKMIVEFYMRNKFGNEFSASSKIVIYKSEIVTLGELFNNFLRQIGYTRKNDLLFMEDITEDEYDAMQSFLDDYRQKDAMEECK